MSKHSARLTRAEQATHQRVLAELAQRYGYFRLVCYARDAEPDPTRPGKWRSETVELAFGLPEAMLEQAMEAVGYQGWEVEPDPNHDAE